MLSEHVELVDIDPEHWMNLVKLSQGGFDERPKREKRKKTSLRVVVEGGRVIKAGHSERGLIDNFESTNLADPVELAREQGVDSVTIYQRGTARRIMHAIQSRLTLEMNMVEQVFLILEEIRNELGKGISSHPRPKVPKVKYAPIHGVAKGLVPANELIVIAIYDDRGNIVDTSGLPIVTSGIVRFNSRGEINLISTTDSLVAAGLAVKDWRRDYARVNELSCRVWGSKQFVGVHAPLSALPDLAREASPKRQGPAALSAMNKSGAIVIDPFPLRLKMMLKMGGMMKR